LLNTPSEDALMKAVETLHALRVVDDVCNLTENIGLKISELPVETKLGVAMINAFKEEFGCSEEILILVSMLSV
jgi:HrpA-like RNA helicase